MSVELRHLRYLVAAAEEGQVSLAAQQLHLAQPAVSQAIAQLERRVGVQLLRRHARGVSPTPAGEAFLDYARLALTAVDQAAEIARGWARSEADELVAGFLPAMHSITTPIFASFRALHPRCRVIPRQLDFATQLVELRAGRIDVEFVVPAPSEPDLVAEQICTSARVLICAARHPLAKEPSLRVEQIADERLARELRDGTWLIRERERRPAVTGDAPVTPDEMCALVLLRNVVAVAPAFVSAQYAGEDLSAVPLVDVPPLTVGVVRRRDDERPYVRAMLDVACRSSGGRDAPVIR